MTLTSISLVAAKLSKDKLLKLPKEELVLLLGLAHLSNDLTTLTKLLLVLNNNININNNNPQDEIEAEGNACQLYLIMKILAGKLYEGYSLLKKYYFSALSKKYSDLLSTEGKNEINEIKKYFSKKNNLETIRNSYVFHYSLDNLDSAFRQYNSDLKMYIEKNARGNNLYQFADITANMGMLQSINSDNLHDALKSIMEETSKITHRFWVIIDELIILILYQNLDDFWEGYAETVEMKNIKHYTDVEIPWLLNTTERTQEKT